ncbi:MAG: hypothetical protein LLF28_05510 [Nitrospiraceae bacterium]|nr:hypothetical protein [Nitrospiraceae bacterium]
MKKQEIIKNPLTLIATFASLSDVAMTAVLPFLSTEIQNILIWFVIGYPVLLVCGFFYILIWKREALYAPSDFKDDASWLEVLQNSQRNILNKYPVEPAISAASKSKANYQQATDFTHLNNNLFYSFLKSLDIKHSDIEKIVLSVDDADKLPDIVSSLTSNKGINDKVKRVLAEFPSSKDDFFKLKSILKGGCK